MTNIKKIIKKNSILSALIFTAIIALLAAGTLSVRTTQAVLTDSTDTIDNKFSPYEMFTLEYHANAGVDSASVTNLPDKQEDYDRAKEQKVDFTVASQEPERPGYVFAGWYMKESPVSDDKKYEGGDTLTATQKHTHLYAQWKAGYKLIYNANGGANAPAARQQVSDAESCTFSNLAVQGDMTGPEHKDSSDPEKTSTDNRVFLGWSTNKDAREPEYTSNGNLAYNNKDNDYDGTKTTGFEKEIEIKAEDYPSKTVTLYAVWATKYELSFKYHPDMVKPKCGDEKKLHKTITLVSATNKAPTFNLVPQAEADTNGWTPTREEGYRWGWWGDNLERFKFNKPGENQTAAQAGNEGCYQFGEPVPARQTGDKNVKAPSWDNPTLTLYAYFQPPSACSLNFNDNTSNNRQFPLYADRNNTYKVTEMPDNKTASFTQTEWRPDIPDITPQHPRYQFLGWSEYMNSTDPELQPGEKAYLNKILNNEVTLYAIWKPMHNFRLTFDRGYKTSSGSLAYTGTNEYYVQTSTRQWKRGGYNIWFDSNATEYETTSSKYFAETSHTWPEGFFTKRGFFTTKDDDSVGTYKFLGWSWEPQEPSTDEEALMKTVAFTVNVPDNPESILNTKPEDDNTVGVIKDAITVNEVTPCTQPTTHGYASNDKNGYTLYAVYRKSPRHQLRVTFDKGSATTLNGKGTTVSGSDCHYITINETTQGSNSYYASIDHPSYIWNENYWKSNTPSAVKNDDKVGDDVTATYTFLGWTTDESQKTPSTSITKGDIDYPVDDSGCITKPIEVKEPASEAKECTGGIHDVKLYPVFRKNLFHVYKLNYDVNAPSTADGIVTKLYDNLNGSWKNVQVFPDPDTMNPVPDPKPKKGDATGNLYTETKELSVKNYEWNLSGKGLFATCDNTGKTPTGKMTFLGWSNKKFKLGEYDPANPPKITLPGGEEVVDPSIKFYPVSAPADPKNPGSEGSFEAGTTIKIDVDEQKPKPSDACTDTEGKVHAETLYGVWAGEPIHQYSVIFAGNSNLPQEDDVEVLYGKKADWDNYQSTGNDSGLTRAKETISKTYKKDNQDIPVKYYDGSTEVNLTKDIKNTYRVFSEALPLPEAPNKTDSYKFEAEFWNDNTDPEDVRDLIVKAERKAGADTRYIFKGWNTKEDGTGTNISVDSNGYITDPLEVKDTDYDNCDAYTHNIILYAQWEEVKIHNFQLIFYGYNANSLGYMDGTTWRPGSSYVKNYKSYIDKNTITDINLPTNVPRWMYYVSQNVTDKYDAEGSNKKTSYTWGETADSAEKLRVMAAKNSDSNFEYEFLGWSEEIKEPSETRTASDADYHVDASGYIQEDIEIDEPGAACGEPTHTLVLYPVFKKVPIHNFSVTLNRNGGSGLRAYNESNQTWSNSSTYTFNYPNDNGAKARVTASSYSWTVDGFWAKRGFSAYRNQDSNYTYEFVGWSTTQVAPSENPDMTNAISWREDSRTPSTSSSHPNEYVNGFINQTITSSCSLSPCQGGEHNVTLYAIWKRAPRTKTYTLKFDANGGINAPSEIEQSETYNGSRWTGYSDFTLSNAQITQAGMKYKKLVFVGWHENARADQGRYGEKNSTNSELETLTQTLRNPYRLEGSAYANEKTLYAIWWFEFNLVYDANGGSNAPEHEHAYTKDSSFPFEISKDVPTHSAGYKFLGWSEKKTTPGQGTEADVQVKPSTGDNKVDWTVTASGDSSSDDYGYTGKTLYAVWGPAN